MGLLALALGTKHGFTKVFLLLASQTELDLDNDQSGREGRMPVGEPERFARQAGYRKIVLWTNSILRSARRIYEASGYRLVHEEPHRSFGHDFVGQTWELLLHPA